MRFGFSDGSCGSVRGSWRFQSPSPKSVENNTFWSLGMAAEPRGGVHNSGLKLAKRVLPHVLLGRGPPRGGVHNSGVWGLKLAKWVLPRVLLGRGRARRTGEYTIRAEACENGTPRVLLGGARGPAAWGSTQFGSLGSGACEKGTPTRAAGARRAGE